MKEKGARNGMKSSNRNNMGNVDRNSIRERMVRSYIRVIAISVVASILALIMLLNTGSKLSSFYKENYGVTMETWTARYAQISARCALLSAIADEDLKVTRVQMEEAKTQLEEMGNIIARMKEHYTGDTALLDEIEENRVAAMSDVGEMLESTAFGLKDKAYTIMKESYTEKVNQIAEDLEKIAMEEDADALRKVNQGTMLVIIALIVVIGVALLSVGIALRLGMRIAKSICDPVREIEDAARRLAEGELEVEIAYQASDELGSLADSMRATCGFLKKVVSDADYLLREMAGGNFTADTESEDAYIGEFRGLLMSIRQLKQQLSSTLQDINDASEQVAAGAGQMAESALALAEGATEQAGAVEELTAMINGVAENTRQAAEITGHSYEQAMRFKEEAENGRREMESLMVAMERISDTSRQIEKIISEIEDIASQTNLLSLNASIEAARAGEAGRGFAVVADQIGKLAADSAQSAVNTRKMIQNTLNEIDNGNDITNRTSQALGKVIKGIHMLAEDVQQVNARALAEADSVAQVEKGIEQISSVIENNSASAQESSATSEELSAQADNLKELAGRFRLND